MFVHLPNGAVIKGEKMRSDVCGGQLKHALYHPTNGKVVEMTIYGTFTPSPLA